jgi:hypothetical protein
LERKERGKDREEKNVVWLKRWRKEKCVGYNSFPPEPTKTFLSKMERKN